MPAESESNTTTTTNPGQLSSVSSLAKLLPTGSVLAFEALAPSFSNNGACVKANKCLTTSIIISCSIACFFLSFTDSFIKNKKLYYGIATFKGFYIFNTTSHADNSTLGGGLDLKKYKITKIDYVHAFGSLIVFLAFAFSNTSVQECFFPRAGLNGKELIRNLPLAASVAGSFVFMIFPTTRRGIGYTEMSPAAATQSLQVETEMAVTDGNLAIRTVSESGI